MSTNSKIEWTDATWNPVTGCAKVSQGCKNCYALREWQRLSKNPRSVYFGRKFTDVQCHPERLQQPIRWTTPRMVFVNSMSDLFHEDVSFEFIAKVFAAMSITTRHTYQVLTKRPERMQEFFQWVADQEHDVIDPDETIIPKWQTCIPGKRGGYDCCGPAWPLTNVWLGVSVEDQDTADERIPILLNTPAAVRWISAEPLLDKINLHNISHSPVAHCALSGGFWGPAKGQGEKPDYSGNKLDWVVTGDESGPKARPADLEWYRSMRDECSHFGVPFFLKQLCVGGRKTKFENWSSDLRVREYPE